MRRLAQPTSVKGPKYDQEMDCLIDPDIPEPGTSLCFQPVRTAEPFILIDYWVMKVGI